MVQSDRGAYLKNIVLGFLLLTGLPTAASAGDLDYTYLQLGLSQSHISAADSLAGGGPYGASGGDNGPGYAVSGSVGLPLGFVLDGSFEEVGFPRNDLQTRTAHAGWHVGVMDSLDLVFRVGRTRLDAYGFSQGGYDANVGLRAQLPAGFEVEGDLGRAGASYTYFGGSGYGLFGPAVTPAKDKETYESVALRHHLTDTVLLGLSYRTGTSHDPIDGDTTLRTWLLAVRFTF